MEAIIGFGKCYGNVRKQPSPLHQSLRIVLEMITTGCLSLGNSTVEPTTDLVKLFNDDVILISVEVAVCGSRIDKYTFPFEVVALQLQ